MDLPVLRGIKIETKNKSLPKKIKAWLSRRKWEVVEDWYFKTHVNGTMVTVFIGKGFVFDGASIPRSLHWLLNPMGVLMAPGLVHDFAYRNEYITILNSRKKLTDISTNQLQADNLFKDISLQVNGCSVISNSAYYMLRIFGKRSWNKNKKLRAERIGKNWEALRDDADHIKEMLNLSKN